MQDSIQPPPIHGHVLWLLPDKQSGAYFKDLITRLSNKYGSPFFTPHVTLAGVRSPAAAFKERLSQIARRCAPFTFKPKRFICGEKPYQKLTLALDEPAGFTGVCDVTDQLFDENISKRLYPHLSVLYGSLPCEWLAGEPDGVTISRLPEIRMEEVALISVNGTPKNWDIEASATLTGSPG